MNGMPSSGGVISRPPFTRTRRVHTPQQGTQRAAGSPAHARFHEKKSNQSPVAPKEQNSWARVASERIAIEKASSMTGGKELPSLDEALRAATTAAHASDVHHEFAAPTQAPSPKVASHPVPARVRMSFDAVDRDKSGYLEANELPAAFSRYGIDLNSRAGLERVVQAAGVDGRLDFDEYATLIGELETERRVTNQLRAFELAVTPRTSDSPRVMYGM